MNGHSGFNHGKQMRSNPYPNYPNYPNYTNQAASNSYLNNNNMHPPRSPRTPVTPPMSVQPKQSNASQYTFTSNSLTSLHSNCNNNPLFSNNNNSFRAANTHASTHQPNVNYLPSHTYDLSGDFENDSDFMDELDCKTVSSRISDSYNASYDNNQQFVECKEVETGRRIWYNKQSLIVSFEAPQTQFTQNTFINEAMASITASEQNLNVNESIAHEDICDDLIPSYLLDFEGQEWDFSNNDYVDVYRSQAARIDHKQLCPHPNDLVFPEFFSNDPIPKKSSFVAIILPPIDFNITCTSWKMAVNVTSTTASDIVSKFVNKMNFSKKEGDKFEPQEFVLKVIGNEEYILFDAKKLIIDYEAVRRAVRNEDDVTFGLVHRPDLDEIICDARELQEDYKETFDTKYPSFVRDPHFLRYEKDGAGDGQSLIEFKLLSSSIPPPPSSPQPPHRMSRSTNNDKISPYGHEPSLRDSLWLRNTIREKNSGGDYSAVLLCDYDEIYRFKIVSLSNVTKLARYLSAASEIKRVIVRHELWMGPLSYDIASYTTPNIARVSDVMQFADWFSCDALSYCDLPREATISLTIYGLSQHEKRKTEVVETPLGFVRLPLIDHRHRLINGKYILNIWPIPVFTKSKHGLKSDPYSHGEEFRYRGATRDRHLRYNYNNNNNNRNNNKKYNKKYSLLDDINKPQHDICQLSIEFTRREFDVVAPLINNSLKYKLHYNNNNNNKRANNNNNISDSDWARIHNIITRDLLCDFSAEEKSLMWRARDQLVSMPLALCPFLACIDWRDCVQRAETCKYLGEWQSLQYLEDALELLSWQFADTRVREYGVLCIANMHDSDLQRYLLQLCECLKFEVHHNNALIRLLMRRALMNPYQIGHFLFWSLFAEYSSNNCESLYIRERFGLYLEEYLLHSTCHSRELLQQSALISRLKYINKKIYRMKKKEKRDAQYLLHALHEMCESLNASMPSIISLPLNPRWRCTHLVVSKCKFFNSAQVPLFLVFRNVDPLADDIQVLFKCGDDLRQDILTLQVFKVMDKVWLNRGLNLRLITYDVVSTGNNCGMVQIIANSCTTNDIHLHEYKNKQVTKSAAQKACRDESSHLKWIKHFNKSRDALAAARYNYARSCAGYCVATYVLGIGDRHPDNIMCRQNGVLFHIDFGHFLGNFKVKKVVANYKWKRERTPFVFSPAMKYVMSHNDDHLYASFEQWFVDAYMALRIRHRLLFNLFVTMIPTQMPELICRNDLTYLRDQLHLNDIAQDKIHKHCKKVIKQCLADKSRILDNIFHAVKHASDT